MKIKYIEQLKFSLTGRSVPVIRVSELDDTGKVGTIHNVGMVKDRANSLVNTWDEKGWEKQKDTRPVALIDPKGNTALAWIVSEDGRTVNLYTQPTAFPRREVVIGHAATMDDIADSMDLGKSMRNLVIGLIIGVMLGWLIIGPMLNTVMS